MTSPWEVKVDVTLESEDPVRFTVDSKTLPKGKNGNFVFDNNGHPGFNISFIFFDATGQGYMWPDNAHKEEAVWSEVGIVCPGPPGKWDVFRVIGVDPGCTTLRVNNPNPKPAQGQFMYTLRVTKDGGQTYLSLDPGGMNQNGSSAKISVNALFIAVAMVALIAIAFYELGVFKS